VSGVSAEAIYRLEQGQATASHRAREDRVGFASASNRRRVWVETNLTGAATPRGENKLITITVSSRAFGKNQQYIARITGRAPKINFAREFVGRRSGKRMETTEYSTDEPGLYEDCDIDRKGSKQVGYLIVTHTPSGEVVKMRSDLEDAMRIGKRFDEGESIDKIIDLVAKEGGGWTYEIRSKAEAKTIVAAATVGAATESCWQIMQALPEREAKKVLAALKARVSPPKPKAESEANAEEPSAPEPEGGAQ
jgi:hypothetical protein